MRIKYYLSMHYNNIMTYLLDNLKFYYNKKINPIKLNEHFSEKKNN